MLVFGWCEFFLHRCFSEKIEVTQEFQFLFRHNRRKDTKCGMTWQFLITLVVSEVKKNPWVDLKVILINYLLCGKC